MGNGAATLMGVERLNETAGRMRPLSYIDDAFLQELFDKPAYGETSVSEPAERYAHSTLLIREVGRMMLHNTVVEPEDSPLVERLRAEYTSAILEMLNTDSEFRDRLEISSEDTYDIVDGEIVTADGVTSLRSLIEKGAITSREKAYSDPRMRIQALRDKTDLDNINAIQELQPGQGRITVSMDPKEAFAQGKDFWEGLGTLGYREGLAFIQWAYRVSDNKMVLGTYSVDKSDLAIWRAIQKQHDVAIPEGETTSTWHAHAAERTATLGELRAEVQAMRTAFYTAEGSITERHSVNDYMRQNQAILDTAFTLFYLPLARSRASGRKDPVIHTMVKGLLAEPDLLNEEALAELTRIYANETFDTAAARMVDHCIRYGVVERLRTGLKFLVKGYKVEVTNFYQGGARYGLSAAEQAARSLAGNIMTGVREQRSYGGCPVEIKLAAARRKNNNDGTSLDNPNENDRLEDLEGGEDESIPDELTCPRCSATSDSEDVIHVDEDGNGVWKCPCCGYYLDVCTGESGYDKEGLHEDATESEHDTVVKAIFKSLGFTTAKL